MIYFFKMKRWLSIKNDKFFKYSKYVIGEIFIVIVGILVALLLHNWNQIRLGQKEEKKILITLKKDFQNAIEEFKVLNDVRTSFISAATDITIIDVTDEKNCSEEYLDSLFTWTLFVPTFNNEQGSLSMVLNTGKINLISNPELEKKLTEWPGDVADMIEEEVSHCDIFYNFYFNILSDYVVMNNLADDYVVNWVRFGKPIYVKMPANPILKSDYESLLRNKKFLNILHRRVRMCSQTNQETDYLIRKAEVIIQMIDDELKE